MAADFVLSPSVEGRDLVGQLLRRFAGRQRGIAADVDEDDGHEPFGGLPDTRRNRTRLECGPWFRHVDADGAQLLARVAGFEPVTPRGRLRDDGLQLAFGARPVTGFRHRLGIRAARRPGLVEIPGRLQRPCGALERFASLRRVTFREKNAPLRPPQQRVGLKALGRRRVQERSRGSWKSRPDEGLDGAADQVDL